MTVIRALRVVFAEVSVVFERLLYKSSPWRAQRIATIRLRAKGSSS